MEMKFIYYLFYLRLFLSSTQFFNSFPFAKPFLIVGRMLFLFILLKIFIGILFMDELKQAVAQFSPPTEGGFSQPPAPTPPPESSGDGVLKYSIFGPIPSSKITTY